MTLSVCNICDQTFRLAKLLAYQLYNINVLHLIVTAYIIHFTDSTLMYDKVNSFAMIFNIQPVTNILAIAINRQKLIIQCICNHERDKLLRKMIWAIVI